MKIEKTGHTKDAGTRQDQLRRHRRRPVLYSLHGVRSAQVGRSGHARSVMAVCDRRRRVEQQGRQELLALDEWLEALAGVRDERRNLAEEGLVTLQPRLLAVG